MADRRVRVRLVVGATAFAAVAISLALFAGRFVIASELRAATESLAQTDLLPFVTDLTNHPDEPPDPPGAGVQVGIQSSDGTWLIDTLPADVHRAVEGREPGIVDVTDRDGDRSWVVVGEAAATSDGTVVVWAARDTTAAVRTLATVDMVFVFGGLALIGLFAVAAWLFVRAALRPVEEARRRERQFVSDAAHELRTPLTGLRAQLSIVRRSVGDGPVASELQRAEESAARLTDLAANLLELARLDDGSPVASTSATELREAFLEAVDDVRATPEAALCSVEQASPAESPDARAAIDAVSFGRVVRNLLANAVRAAGTGGSVVATLSFRGAHLDLEVRDDGPGIPEDFLPRALERFARVDVSGSGLGLALVDALARAAGGGVTIENTRPGVLASVRLPLH